MRSSARLAGSLLLAVAVAAACGRAEEPAAPAGLSLLAGSCTNGCSPGFACTAGHCALNPTGLWAVTVSLGQVQSVSPAGGAWDVFGGAPDPFVCLTIGDVRSCTSPAQDTFQPVWNSRFAAVSATALLGKLTADLEDADITANDPICGPRPLLLREQNFLIGSFAVSCDYGGFSATLTPQ